jgi:hypothetical protein
MISYREVPNERSMRACTGLDFIRFDELSILLEEYYISLNGICYFEMMANLRQSHKIIFKDYKDILFFVLYAQKTGATFDVLGLNFGMTGASAHNNLLKFSGIMSGLMREAGHEPLREIKCMADVLELASHGEVLAIDATEIHTQRPNNKEIRDKSYSLKKKFRDKGDDNIKPVRADQFPGQNVLLQ